MCVKNADLGILGSSPFRRTTDLPRFVGEKLVISCIAKTLDPASLRKMSEKYVALTTSNPSIIDALRNASLQYARPRNPTAEEVIGEAWKDAKVGKIDTKAADMVRAANYVRELHSSSRAPEPPSAPVKVSGQMSEARVHLVLDGQESTFDLHSAQGPIEVYAGCLLYTSRRG